MNRYKYQEKFKNIGEKGSEMRKKKVIIVGVGGLGSVVSEMLHREGVNMKIVDKGRIEMPDLQRQAVYKEEDDNRFKAKQIKKRLEMINSENKVKTFHEELVEENLFLLDDVDVVVDCSNELATMKMIANYIKKKTHLINCKYAGSQGAIFISNKKHLFKTVLDKVKIGDIKDEGIINAGIHVAAGIIVAQVLKILVGEKLTDNLIVYDVWKDQVRRVNI
ncbi:MAG: ThiF family adenylyltransferase [Nanoarchaeota archaeon]|nr:ThiF family adenylyltransferase [Nanoarchaeota archaeon]MBU1031254.1 ThiF family adenylyltransferase [Nanoarchaeota archaeon]MBU1849595.1 ThiF family adenylyltransferase [Nanoarchaeota archaeon]